MVEVERCPGCGVPRHMIDEHIWLNNGVIVLERDQTLRMVFIECENLDPLFKGIEELIGVPIERIIIDGERKGSRDYYSPFIPREVKDMVRRFELTLDHIIDAVIMTGRLNGVGRYELVDYLNEMNENNFITLRIAHPHSLPIACGDVAGGSEAVVGIEHGKVTYKEVAPDVYEITASASGIPEELAGRLERKQYDLREGDIELARCSVCGGPEAMSDFKWHLDRGIIMSARRSRRISIVHPSVLDPVFEVLERELGEDLPRVVVEAQRRFTKTGFYSVGEIEDEEDFRTQLALRGMGNLRELSMGPAGLRMRLDNACLHLMLTGMVQGLFELGFHVESEVDWELSKEGDLEVEVKPKA